jgi:hypothetical protein
MSSNRLAAALYHYCLLPPTTVGAREIILLKPSDLRSNGETLQPSSPKLRAQALLDSPYANGVIRLQLVSDVVLIFKTGSAGQLAA